jgi:hypothetical protein
MTIAITMIASNSPGLSTRRLCVQLATTTNRSISQYCYRCSQIARAVFEKNREALYKHSLLRLLRAMHMPSSSSQIAPTAN